MQLLKSVSFLFYSFLDFVCHILASVSNIVFSEGMGFISFGENGPLSGFQLRKSFHY